MVCETGCYAVAEAEDSKGSFLDEGLGERERGEIEEKVECFHGEFWVLFIIYKKQWEKTVLKSSNFEKYNLM